MENITIKELVKDIDLTDTTILRLKGHRNISHDNRLKNPLLSDQVGILTLEAVSYTHLTLPTKLEV